MNPDKTAMCIFRELLFSLEVHSQRDFCPFVFGKGLPGLNVLEEWKKLLQKENDW